MKFSTVLLILAVVIALGSMFYKRYISNKLMDELSKAFLKEDGEKEYMDILNSRKANIAFSDGTKLYLKMNFYILKNDTEKAKEVYEELTKSSSVTDEEKIIFNRQALAYFSAKEEKEVSEQAYNILKDILGDKDNKESEAILKEAYILLNVNIYKNMDIIPELEEIIKETENDDMKSIYYFLIAKLYNTEDDKMIVDKYLNLSRDFAENEVHKDSIDHILKGNYEDL